MAIRYVLDTNLFIDAFRDTAENDALQRFHAAFAPFELFSAVVGHELKTGVRSPDDRRRLDRHLIGAFERSGRIVVPSYKAWTRSAVALAALAETDGVTPAQFSRAFANDVLIAASCREVGATLVTRNYRDFERIQRVIAFRSCRRGRPRGDSGSGERDLAAMNRRGDRAPVYNRGLGHVRIGNVRCERLTNRSLRMQCH